MYNPINASIPNIEAWLSNKPTLSTQFPHWLIAAPNEIFTPPLTDIKQRAISEWYLVCVEISATFSNNAQEKQQWLQLAYAYLQKMAINTDYDAEVRKWCLLRLDRLIIALLEVCPQTNSDPTSLIEAHISFMGGQGHRNLPRHLKTTSSQATR
ncbi:hypothetical protein [Thaumasiovibrio sp. DFM-14]|uniref:hypothetical protein n=1 Tax=Thaumasiovibrio sp. DFM-14 TaxID=3384792 RepID=UPI0039A3E14E